MRETHCETVHRRTCTSDVQGIALGFVLLRVESLVEEGKL